MYFDFRTNQEEPGFVQGKAHPVQVYNQGIVKGDITDSQFCVCVGVILGDTLTDIFQGEKNTSLVGTEEIRSADTDRVFCYSQ